MELKDFLNNNDRFAKYIGAQITEIGDGYALARMEVTEKHLNGGNVCQGGAIFTLADLAIAAVMNCHGNLTVGIQSNIAYTHSAAVGDILTAEAVEVVNHQKIPYCEVKVYNQKGELIAAVSGVGYRKKDKIINEVKEER